VTFCFLPEFIYKSMTRLAVALIFALILSACNSSPQAESGAMVFPPVPVSLKTATEESVPIQVRAVGTVEPYTSVEVKAQVGGELLNVKFAEGANVKKGDLLFEIDSRPFRETLRQAEAALRRNEAQLRAAEANLARARAQLKNAQTDAARYAELSKEGLSARMQVEQVRTAAEVAAESVRADEAAIESFRATLESDRATVEQARLNLSYCEIRAPISGRTGNLLLHPGNLVKANDDKPLVVINQIAPIFVTFGVPERYLSSISHQNTRRKLVVDASAGANSGVVRGNLSVIDNTVDSKTGTIRLKATFDNRDGNLWPGQFVNVALTMEPQTATVIPSEAVQAGQQGSFVYVVKADQTVEARPVLVGQAFEGKVIVEKGVTSGETVVTDGQSRLFPGAKVVASADATSQAK
jgi:membrane fusion protein, multidrug efflux system